MSNRDQNQQEPQGREASDHERLVTLRCDPVSTIALHDAFKAIGIDCETEEQLAVATFLMANAMSRLAENAR